MMRLSVLPDPDTAEQRMLLLRSLSPTTCLLKQLTSGGRFRGLHEAPDLFVVSKYRIELSNRSLELSSAFLQPPNRSPRTAVEL